MLTWHCLVNTKTRAVEREHGRTWSNTIIWPCLRSNKKHLLLSWQCSTAFDHAQLASELRNTAVEHGSNKVKHSQTQSTQLNKNNLWLFDCVRPFSTVFECDRPCLTVLLFDCKGPVKTWQKYARNRIMIVYSNVPH